VSISAILLFVPNVIEAASSGRAKCRGCGQSIARGELRFGERLPNPFAEGELTLWFHLKCAAYKRPEPLLQTLTEVPEIAPDREVLEEIARRTLSHRRLPRIDGAERAPGSMAKCRSCHEPIERGHWRIRLVFYEEGMFSPGGFIHLHCSGAYFETPDVWEHVLHFSPKLTDEEREDLRRGKNERSI
jgi:hypothetical protein